MISKYLGKWKPNISYTALILLTYALINKFQNSCDDILGRLSKSH